MDFSDTIFSVAQYIEILNTFFKKQAVKVRGEVCEIKRADSGHVYFAVKDKNDNALLNAIIWNRNYQLCGIALEVGMEVVLTGKPNIYAARGTLSFVADTIELVGEGALKKAYDALKKKLEAEGIFAPERKRELPEYIQRVGVITSMKGAVIHDFMNNLGKFGFSVNVLDSRVEGQQAIVPLIEALAEMRREAEEGRIEVLVIIRGGGSLEALQAFNNEALVREIGGFPVPVIAGIGHDQDVPLVALAADFMTSTPTAAAHLLSAPWEEAYAKIHRAAYVLARLEQQIERVGHDLDLAWSSMVDHIAQAIVHAKNEFDYAERFLKTNDPRRQLALGYAIVRRNGKIIKSTRDARAGDELSTELRDGVLRSRVEGQTSIIEKLL